jgi:chromosomal replication initiation ATPase DnaA
LPAFVRRVFAASFSKAVLVRSILEEHLGRAIRDTAHQFLGGERRFLHSLSIDRLQDSHLWLKAKVSPPASRTIDRVCSVIGPKLSEALQVELDLHVTLDRAGGDSQAREQRSRTQPSASSHSDPSVRGAAAAEPLVDSGNMEAVRALEAYAHAQLEHVRLIYLYGGRGYGKTFLMDWFQRHVDVPCVRWTALDLHREIQSARKVGRLQKLRDSLRSCETLLIDEVHRLRSCRRSQEELGRVVDELIAADKRILMAGRHHPYKIYEFQTPLASRLLGGYTIELRGPQPETRLQFSERLWRELTQLRDVPRDQKDVFLSWMRGAQTYGELRQRSVDFFERLQKGEEPAPRSLIGDARERQQHQTDRWFDELVDRVARVFDVRPEELRERESGRRRAQPRQVVAFVASQGAMAGPEIARRLSWKSASSVTYAIRRVKEMMEKDPELRRLIETCL